MARHTTMYAVRRDWPDGGHDYFRLSQTAAAAQGGIEQDRQRRRLARTRPTSYRVVQIGASDFELHRDRQHCNQPNCP